MLPTTAEGTSAISEIGVERIIGKLAVQERIHHQRAVDRHQQRVAVRRCLRDRLGTDDRVGSRPIVDDDLLPQVFAHFLTDEAAEKIGGPAGREGNDQRDLPHGIGLGGRGRNEEREQCGGGGKTMQLHGSISDCLSCIQVPHQSAKPCHRGQRSKG
jgi:hypothetical protein